MTCFVDTSALYALMDRDDDNHAAAGERFLALRGQELLTHSYVLVETSALVQRRLGPAALRRFLVDLVPVLSVCWVDEVIHFRAVSALLASGKRKVSLVDQVSFEVMRQRLVTTAFAFHDDFRREGFTVLRFPSP